MRLRELWFAVLALALVISAVGAAYLQHQRRALFAELNVLERVHDEKQVEWGQLRLEQSVWIAHERIERMAAEQLDLEVPAPERIVLVMP